MIFALVSCAWLESAETPPEGPSRPMTRIHASGNHLAVDGRELMPWADLTTGDNEAHPDLAASLTDLPVWVDLPRNASWSEVR